MARTWLSIRVELVEGRAEALWPRPGRVFAAARSHSFADLAAAADVAFARWDRSHLHLFDRGDGRLLASPEWDDLPDGAQYSHRVKLSTLQPGEQFVYTFDLGDDWTHLCTVAPARVDPFEILGVLPEAPLAYDGWGTMPDQYGRAFEGDDGESSPGPAPGIHDLPPLLPHWGPQRRR